MAKTQRSHNRPGRGYSAYAMKIELGDAVFFVPTDTLDNSETIPRIIPEGAQAWKGKINEQISVPSDQEASTETSADKCTPHYGMGMFGLIQAGDSIANLDTAQTVKHPGKAV